MALTWWQRVVAKGKRAVAKPERSRRRRRRALCIESLESRVLLAVSVVPGTGNTVSIFSDSGDNLWLRTSAANLQYSTDGTNYSSLGITVAQDVTVTLGAFNEVHLGSTSGDQIIGQGHALTFQAHGIPSGSFGQLAAPKNLCIDNTIATAGGSLSVLNMQGIDVAALVTVSTRNIGSSTDYLSAHSTGNSGALTLTSENPDTLNPAAQHQL
jgi:hypothetical protein